jgi:hypothetical protein
MPLQQARATSAVRPRFAVDGVWAESPGHEHIVIGEAPAWPGVRESLYRKPGAPSRKISRRRTSHGEKHPQKDQAA